MFFNYLKNILKGFDWLLSWTGVIVEPAVGHQCKNRFINVNISKSKKIDVKGEWQILSVILLTLSFIYFIF